MKKAAPLPSQTFEVWHISNRSACYLRDAGRRHSRGSAPVPERVAARLRHSCALEKRTVEYGAQVDGTLPDGNHCHLCYAIGEGIELGKVLAQRIISAFESTAKPTRGHDSSANNLIRLYRILKEML